MTASLDGAAADASDQLALVFAANPIQRKEDAVTKSEQVYLEVEELVASGMSKASAFKRLAEQHGQTVGGLRGAYYAWTGRENGGTPRRTKRRQTSPDDALADARAALERAISAIDAEVLSAKERADEAKSEYDAIKASAPDRKQAISERLEALS